MLTYSLTQWSHNCWMGGGDSRRMIEPTEGKKIFFLRTRRMFRVHFVSKQLLSFPDWAHGQSWTIVNRELGIANSQTCANYLRSTPIQVRYHAWKCLLKSIHLLYSFCKVGSVSLKSKDDLIQFRPTFESKHWKATNGGVGHIVQFLSSNLGRNVTFLNNSLNSTTQINYHDNCCYIEPEPNLEWEYNIQHAF